MARCREHDPSLALAFRIARLFGMHAKDIVLEGAEEDGAISWQSLIALCHVLLTPIANYVNNT